MKYVKTRSFVTILNLHRVAPDDGSAYPPLDPGLFRTLLKFVTRYYNVTVFSRLEDAPLDRPSMVLSFDDGYKDFLDYAVPLLEEYGLYANQNIIPDCIESGFPPFNVIVQDFVGRAPQDLLYKIDIPGFDMRMAKRNPVKLSNYLKNRKMDSQRKLRDYVMEQILEHKEYLATEMMSVDDIRQLSGHHEFGVHSYEHASMAFESDEYIFGDALRCLSYFKEKFSQDPKIYAFPNGSYKPHHLDLIRRSGFETILLVGENFSTRETSVHYRFSFNATTQPEVVFRATGAYTVPFLS